MSNMLQNITNILFYPFEMYIDSFSCRTLSVCLFVFIFLASQLNVLYEVAFYLLMFSFGNL